MVTRRPKFPPQSCVPIRALLGYMAFNHATGAMTLGEGYEIGRNELRKAIYNFPPNYEATVFSTIGDAAVWIDRTIKNGRREWVRKARRDGLSTNWQESDWKWLFRQTWSVVPVFMALESEHPLGGR